MIIAITGSSGNLGRILVPILKESGHKVISFGRRHHACSDVKIDWSLSEAFPNDVKIDYLIHLAFDYSKIKNSQAFTECNTTSLRQLIETPHLRSKLIVPLSLSANSRALSRYGAVKWQQELLCEQHEISTVAIGWLDEDVNGNSVMQSAMKLMTFLNFNILPSGGSQPIFLSNTGVLRQALIKIFQGKSKVIGFELEPITLKQLVFRRSEPRFVMFGYLTEILLRALPILYWLLPSKMVRAIDSARSLL